MILSQTQLKVAGDDSTLSSHATSEQPVEQPLRWRGERGAKGNLTTYTASQRVWSQGLEAKACEWMHVRA